MRNKLARLLLLLLGSCLGVGLAEFTLEILAALGKISAGSDAWQAINISIYIAGILFGLLLTLSLSVPLTKAIMKFVYRVEGVTRQTPVTNVIFGAVGLVLALLIAYLITRVLGGFPLWFEIPLSIMVYLLFAYLGVSVGTKRWREVPIFRKYFDREENDTLYLKIPKILDTSVLIDGRVFELCKMGFLEGEIIVPAFVLAELQHVADSSDSLRRNRGRRGFDVLSRLQTELKQPVIIEEKDYAEIEEVDAKLLRLAGETGGRVLTNDYNLSKLASVTGIGVINLNELAKILKPVMLPGEALSVQIVKEGREAGQGVGYLDDGTMIVVDGAKSFVGRLMNVEVTSVLQTSAGRMIFSKVPEGFLEE